MRVIVFFDLPTETDVDKRNYRKFRRMLIKDGFMMMQESVYCKLAQNGAAADAIAEHVRKNRPSDGLVQLLKITEKQYSKMEFIVGSSTNHVLDSDERLVIL